VDRGTTVSRNSIWECCVARLGPGISADPERKKLQAASSKLDSWWRI